MQSKIIEALAETLPPIILRKNVEKITGGLIKAKTLSNHDTKKTGPEESNNLYGKKMHSKKAFLEWLGKGLSQNRLPAKEQSTA